MTSTQSLDKYGWRDRAVPARQVKCPSCSAEPGEWCRTQDGKPSKTNHNPRREVAIRAGL